jgi:hypothetical protein
MKRAINMNYPYFLKTYGGARGQFEFKSCVVVIFIANPLFHIPSCCFKVRKRRSWMMVCIWQQRRRIGLNSTAYLIFTVKRRKGNEEEQISFLQPAHA